MAQVLLTHADLADRVRANNARAALGALLEAGAVPILNENDSVAVDEIRFGDNDQLAAMVAPLVDADLVVLLSDVDGLLDGKGGAFRWCTTSRAEASLTCESRPAQWAAGAWPARSRRRAARRWRARTSSSPTRGPGHGDVTAVEVEDVEDDIQCRHRGDQVCRWAVGA